MSWKHVDLVLLPTFLGTPFDGEGSGTATDQGLFARVTPYDSFDGTRRFASLDSALALRVDGSFGVSTLNDDRPPVTFGAETDRMVEQSITGWAAHVVAHPRALTRHLEEKHLGWLDRTLSPLLSFGAAWDQTTYRYDYFDTSGASVRESKVKNRGWELGFLNILTIRRGHVSDPDGSIDGPASGWSLGFNYAGIGGFRYDEATTPQAKDPETGLSLTELHRKAWSIFLDPIEASRRIF